MIEGEILTKAVDIAALAVGRVITTILKSRCPGLDTRFVAHIHYRQLQYPKS